MRYRSQLWGIFSIAVACLGGAGVIWASGAYTVPLDDVVEPAQDGHMLIPLPQSVTWLDGDFAVGTDVPIVVADDPAPADLAAVRDVNLTLATFGIKSHVIRASDVQDPKGAIVLGQAATNPWVARLLPTAADASSALPAEGYWLWATPDAVVVAGVDPRGTYWGAQTLRQLLARTDQGVVVRGVKISDWPDFPLRALHMFPSYESDRLHLKIVTDVMAPLKFNTLILQVEQSKWDSHPELWTSNAASKEMLVKLAEAARQHQIEVIPLVNLFGHMEWAFRGGNNLSMSADPAKAYAYDPLNPASYAFAEQILSEVIELFHPRYVHIGHDEVRMNGPIPTHGRPFGQVFVDEVKRLHDYLASCGVGTMMWADEALKPDVYPYLSQLPKDIVMVYWNYGDSATYSDMTKLQRLGFPVLAAAWYDPQNIEELTRTAKSYQVQGMVGTTWAGFFPGMESLYRASRQYVAYVLDAEFFWNAYGRNRAALPYDPAAVLSSLLSLVPRSVDYQKLGFSVDLKRVANANAARLLGSVVVERRIDGFNQPRGTNQLIVYTPAAGRSTTLTNKWGTEVSVENGRITAIGGNNRAIPADGFVISGHGEASSWLVDNAVLGARVIISGQTLRLITDDKTEPYTDLVALPRGVQRLGGIRFDLIDPAQNGGLDAVAVQGDVPGDSGLPARVRIPVNHKASALWFLQSATHRLDTLAMAGSYTVIYSDGSKAGVPLLYGLNLIAWNDRTNVDVRDPSVWARNGRRLYALRWTNPNPDQPIAFVEMSAGYADTSLVLLALTGVE